MKTILASVSALALCAMTSAALAAEPTGPVAGPVELTNAQMDGITAGSHLLDIDIDVSRNNVAVALPVNAAANVCAVLAACAQRASAEQRPGRIQQ